MIRTVLSEKHLLVLLVLLLFWIEVPISYCFIIFFIQRFSLSGSAYLFICVFECHIKLLQQQRSFLLHISCTRCWSRLNAMCSCLCFKASTFPLWIICLKSHERYRSSHLSPAWLCGHLYRHTILLSLLANTQFYDLFSATYSISTYYHLNTLHWSTLETKIND